MARVTAILRCLWTVFWRDMRSIASVATNNFFLLSVFIMGPGAGFVYVLIGLLVLFPLSTDPLRMIPAERLALWPLETRERRLLRIVSPWLNPVAWLLAVLLIRRTFSWGLWAAAIAVFAVGFLTPTFPLHPHAGAWRWLPNLPGPLNQLIRKNLREMLSTLDYYLALLLAMVAGGFRAAGVLPAEGLFAMTFVVVLAVSSYAQCLFGLDGEDAWTRYRLLPVRGWQLLAGKDAAFLLLVVPLTLPLSPAVGLAAALVALALGHGPSVTERREQRRWRFFSGVSFMNGIAQAVMMATAAAGITYASRLVLLPCVAGYVVSTWWYGREIERIEL